MKIDAIDVSYVGHVCFCFCSPGGAVLLTDPLFASGFMWEGHREDYLSPPAVSLKGLGRCDCVFVTHEHGDHFDPEAVLTVLDRTDAHVVAPAEVLETLAREGAESGRFLEAREGDGFTFGDLRLSTYCGYDDSFDPQGRPNKFSAIIESGAARLFYSGDCHDIPPALKGTEVDAMLCWPHTDPLRLEALCAGLKAQRFVIMHCDRFAPGDFMCNMDPEKEAKRVRRAAPSMEVIAPERIEQWPPCAAGGW